MNADNPLESLARSVLEGTSIDWDLAETRVADTGQVDGIRAMRDIDQIVRHNRTLQRQPGPAVRPPEQWGHLTVLERASAGKSGEIWRAWDAWLQREVALKFLLRTEEQGTDDAALLDEARALARVRHTGVVAVYGIGEHAGRIGMWMELLIGNTLELEIARRGPLPPSEVAQTGLDLCRALEAVVAAGLVHRDIKPANIVRESNGRIVLTDFGLGRRLVLGDSDPWRSSGTPVFMSPEQLAGESATPRSDLYALGVTLRWALTGRCPFRARTLEDLRVEAAEGPARPLRAERPDAPASLTAAIERAMAPRAEARFSGPALLAEALREVLREADPGSARRRKWRRAVPWVAAVLIVGTVALLVAQRTGRSGLPRPAKFIVAAPAGMDFDPTAALSAISPDGRLLVFEAIDSVGTMRLWLRALDSVTPRVLEGTENASGPFWSPDSRDVGFFADSKLKKIPVSVGPPEVLCEAPDARGGAWGKDGVIVFAPTVAGPLCRVSAEGGAVTEIQRPDTRSGETALRWPQFLPDGKRFFFVALPPREGGFDVFVASPDSRERRRVMRAESAPICAGKEGIILASNGRLMFQNFDYDRLRGRGAPIALGIAPFADVSVGQPLASASMNGVLAHPSETVANTRLNWLDRSGRRVGELELPEGRYEKLFFAPDGKRLLAERRTSPTTVDLWMIDVEGGGARRFSHGTQSRIGGAPVWSPDGSRIAFNSNRSGRTYIYERLVNEAGEEKLLYQSPGQFNEVLQWSPDGRFLVFQQAAPSTGWDIWLLRMDGKHEATPYLQSRFHELAASLSPDGRWLAYTTDATGKHEVYVRSFPKPGVERLVASAPGWFSMWTRSGRELFIGNISGMWSVPVSTTPTFRAGELRRLFRRRPESLWAVPTPEGDRFLEVSPAEGSEPRAITVDMNFLARVGH